MPRFELRQSAKLQLTSYAGLALVGQCCQVAQLEAVIDPKLPVSQGMRTSDVVKAMIGLLTLGKSDYEAIEPFRGDRFFKQALSLSKVPGSVWLRQRLDARAADLRELTDELSLRLIERAQAPITPHQGYVCLDLDTFVMNNEGSRKECVGRTYQGVDGYTPIAAYLGNEGWNIGLELRPGVQHSAAETHYFLERIFPRAERLVAQERDRWGALGRSLEFITQWNPRKQVKAAWLARAEAAGAFVETRPGKRVALLSLGVERAWQRAKRPFRLIVELIERTINKRGQYLLVPDIELCGWWTSLRLPASEVIGLYQHHGTHEQFHSELKTDLDLERLPSGKFDTNDALLHLGSFAYNCLRLIGQLGLTGEIAPIRHPAKRRRLKTVLQEIIYRAAQFVTHARRWILDFGRGVAAHVEVFAAVQHHLAKAASP